MSPLDARQSNTEKTNRKSKNWWLWLLVFIGALLVLWYLLDQNAEPEWQEETPAEAIDREY